LRNGPGESVEDIARFRAACREGITNDLEYEGVWYEIAALERRADPITEPGASRDVRTQQLAARDMRDVVVARQDCTLGALPGTGRAE
jgi:hypothetical protein